jgi:hypothetical protein
LTYSTFANGVESRKGAEEKGGEEAVSDLLNGEVVAALSQWQGVALIIGALAVAYGVWRLGRWRGLRKA